MSEKIVTTQTFSLYLVCVYFLLLFKQKKTKIFFIKIQHKIGGGGISFSHSVPTSRSSERRERMPREITNLSLPLSFVFLFFKENKKLNIVHTREKLEC